MRRVTSEYLFMKHQLAVLSRKCMRSPNLTSADQILFGLFSMSINPRRLLRSCLIISPATILSIANRKELQKAHQVFFKTYGQRGYRATDEEKRLS